MKCRLGKKIDSLILKIQGHCTETQIFKQLCPVSWYIEGRNGVIFPSFFIKLNENIGIPRKCHVSEGMGKLGASSRLSRAVLCWRNFLVAVILYLDNFIIIFLLYSKYMNR